MERDASEPGPTEGNPVTHESRGDCPGQPDAGRVRIGCPDCGTVALKPDVWDAGRPVSGECPRCGDRLYFG